MAYGLLPGIRLAWDAYAESGTFVQYNVYRRERRSVLDSRTTVENAYLGTDLFIQTADVVGGIQVAIAVRGSFPWDNTSEPGTTPTILYQADDANNYRWLYYDNATNSFKYDRKVSGSSVVVTVAHSIVADDPYTLVIYDTASLIGLSVNGAAFVTAASTNAALTEELMDVGHKTDLQPSSIALSWLVTFVGELTNADAAIIAAWDDDEFGDYPPSFEALRSLSEDTIPSGLLVGTETTMYKLILADYIAIAEIDDVDRTFYTDRAAASGQLYEYAVTVTANVFGDIFESEKQDPPVTASVTFKGIAIHNVYDASDYAIVQWIASRVAPQQEVADVLASGRSKPTPQYGELGAASIHIEPSLHALNDTEDWDVLLQFVTAQRDEGAVLMVRPGYMPVRYFCSVRNLERAAGQMVSTLSFDFQEINYEE